MEHNDDSIWISRQDININVIAIWGSQPFAAVGEVTSAAN